MTSQSIVIKPQDYRCRYWAKLIRADKTLPLPCDVKGANDLQGIAYAQKGDEELFVGDVLIEGEELHHRKNRGWLYHITYINKKGELTRLCPTSEIKKYLKENGLPVEYLAGSGDIAACVRIAHGLRAGLEYK